MTDFLNETNKRVDRSKLKQDTPKVDSEPEIIIENTKESK